MDLNSFLPFLPPPPPPPKYKQTIFSNHTEIKRTEEEEGERRKRVDAGGGIMNEVKGKERIRDEEEEGRRRKEEEEGRRDYENKILALNHENERMLNVLMERKEEVEDLRVRLEVKEEEVEELRTNIKRLNEKIGNSQQEGKIREFVGKMEEMRKEMTRMQEELDERRKKDENQQIESTSPLSLPSHPLPFTQLEQEWALKYNSLELEFENLAAKTFTLEAHSKQLELQAELLQTQKQDLLHTILQLQKDFNQEKDRLLKVIEEKGIENLVNKSKISELETQVNLESSLMQTQTRVMEAASPMEQIKRGKKGLPSSPPPINSLPYTNIIPLPSPSHSSLSYLAPNMLPNSETEELRLKIEMKERENRRIEGRMVELVDEIDEWKKRYGEIEEKLKKK